MIELTQKLINDNDENIPGWKKSKHFLNKHPNIKIITGKDKTGNLLKRLEDLFVSEERVRIKKQQPRLIKIKTMKQTEASVSKVEYHKEVY